MWVKGGSSSLSLVFILFFKAQVEFKNCGFNHCGSTLQGNKPVRANVFSKAASAFLKSWVIAGLPAIKKQPSQRACPPEKIAISNRGTGGGVRDPWRAWRPLRTSLALLSQERGPCQSLGSPVFIGYFSQINATKKWPGSTVPAGAPIRSSFLSHYIVPGRLPHRKHTDLGFMSALKIQSMDLLFSRLTVWLSDLWLFTLSEMHNVTLVKTTISLNPLQEISVW